MKIGRMLLCVGAMSFFLCGCSGSKPEGTASEGTASEGATVAPPAKDTHEAAMDSMMGLMGEFADALESATDKASAEAAAKKLEGLESKFEALSVRMKALGEPSDDLKKELEEKMKTKMEATMKRFMSVAMGLAAKPEVNAIIAPAMQKLQAKMNSLQP